MKAVAGILIFFALFSCDSIRDYRVRAKIIANVRNELELKVSEEYTKALGSETIRRGDWVAFVLDQTSVDVGEITVSGDDTYSAPATIRTVSNDARAKMLGIIQPLGPKLNAFNFENALVLIGEHGVKTESVQEKTIKVGL